MKTRVVRYPELDEIESRFKWAENEVKTLEPIREQIWEAIEKALENHGLEETLAMSRSYSPMHLTPFESLESDILRYTLLEELSSVAHSISPIVSRHGLWLEFFGEDWIDAGEGIYIDKCLWIGTSEEDAGKRKSSEEKFHALLSRV